MADPRASVKTVPRERLEGKTPRDAFALVGNIIAEFQASFRACYHHDRWISLSLSLSLSFFLSNDPCRNPCPWTQSRIVYTESNVHSTIGRRGHRVFRDFTFRLILLAIVLFDVSSRGTHTHTHPSSLPQIISISLECRAIVSESSYVSDGRASSARGYNR